MTPCLAVDFPAAMKSSCPCFRVRLAVSRGSSPHDPRPVRTRSFRRRLTNDDAPRRCSGGIRLHWHEFALVSAVGEAGEGPSTAFASGETAGMGSGRRADGTQGQPA